MVGISGVFYFKILRLYIVRNNEIIKLIAVDGGNFAFMREIRVFYSAVYLEILTVIIARYHKEFTIFRIFIDLGKLQLCGITLEVGGKEVEYL